MIKSETMGDQNTNSLKRLTLFFGSPHMTATFPMKQHKGFASLAKIVFFPKGNKLINLENCLQ